MRGLSYCSLNYPNRLQRTQSYCWRFRLKACGARTRLLLCPHSVVYSCDISVGLLRSLPPSLLRALDHAALSAFNLRIIVITNMENSFSFTPLWKEISIAKRVDPALKPLHGIILQRALKDLPESENKKLQTEGMYCTVLLAFALTFSRHS